MVNICYCNSSSAQHAWVDSSRFSCLELWAQLEQLKNYFCFREYNDLEEIDSVLIGSGCESRLSESESNYE